MESKVNVVVDVPVEAVREIVIAAVKAAHPGHVEPAKVQFDIRTETEGMGLSEIDRSDLRAATLVVHGSPVQEHGMTVARQTNVRVDEPELRAIVAAHVSARLKLKVRPQDVEFRLHARFQGDFGFEGPSLTKAVVTVENA